MERLVPALMGLILCEEPRSPVTTLRATSKKVRELVDHKNTWAVILDYNPGLRVRLYGQKVNALHFLRCWRRYERIPHLEAFQVVSPAPYPTMAHYGLWAYDGHRLAICDGTTIKVSQLDTGGQLLPPQSTSVFAAAFCNLKIEAIWFTDSALRIRVQHGPTMEAPLIDPPSTDKPRRRNSI